MQEQQRCKDIAERAEELKERKEELKEELGSEEFKGLDNYTLSNYQFLTGLMTGEIVDLEHDNSGFGSSELRLDVKTQQGVEISVDVEDQGDYSENNELVRLLEWKDIPDGRIDDLIGEEITLFSEQKHPRKSEDLRDIRWNVYIPQSLDKAGKTIFRLDNIFRRLGAHRFDWQMHNSRDPYIDVSIYASAWGTVALIISLIILPILNSTEGIALSFLLSLFLPAICNYSYEGWMKYRKYREKDSVKQNLR